MKLFETTERRLEINKRGIEIDVVERKSSSEEISKIFDVLSLLVEKLRKERFFS